MSLFALLSCEPEYNPYKKYATIENFIYWTELGPWRNITLTYRSREDQSLKSCPHRDKEEIVIPSLKEINFLKIEDQEEIKPLKKSYYIADVVSTYNTTMGFSLFPDYIHARVLATDGDGSEYTTYYKVSKEDGGKIYNAIKEGYEKGKALPHTYYSSCPFDPSDYDYHPKEDSQTGK